MKLTVTLQDKRPLPQAYAGAPMKYEEYERVAVIDMTGPGFVLAGTLRAIADDIDPQAIAFEKRERSL